MFAEMNGSEPSEIPRNGKESLQNRVLISVLPQYLVACLSVVALKVPVVFCLDCQHGQSKVCSALSVMQKNS